MKVLVIIVTYNGMRWVERCFGSLPRSEMPVDAIVIDNGSTDGTPQWISEHYPDVKVIVNEKNTGFGAANNIGMRHALENGYDYVYLLNQDAWLLPDTIGKLVAVAQSAPDYGILSPIQMNDGMEEMNGLFKNRVVPSRVVRREDLWEVPFVMAAHWLVSRRAMEEAGLFSPLFHVYGEDDNYCARILYHGMRIGVVPGAVAVHDIGDRKQGKDRLMLRSVYTLALSRFSDPRRKPSSQLLFVVFHSFSACLRFKSLRPLSLLADAIRDYPKAKKYRSLSMSKGAFVKDEKVV